MVAVGTRGARPQSRRSAYEVVTLVLLAYVPFLLSSPGRLSSDTKQYLYLDPGRFLTRVPWLWDPHVAAGTVPHQQLGYLFPMGPFFWLADLLGSPDWIAQRLWLGSISLAAALGARWLFRRLGLGPTAALVAALVYMLSPYQLAFTARISVLLLPWAALPWIVGLTMRATARGGWRDPAWIALILLTIGGVNASALVLVALGPALWIVLELFAGRDRARAALAATARIAVLALGVSAWWIAGLYLQGSRGLPILQLTENVRTVAGASSPGDILRGLGNWFFYGYDRAGPSLVQSPDYVRDSLVVVTSYLVPALALLAGGLVRWRARAYCALCIVVGTIVGVGAWPYDDSTPWGALWKQFTNDTSVGLALRNSPRVVPVVVLGVAGLVGAGVAACRPVVVRRVLAAAVVAVVALAFLPVWRDGYLTPGVERPNDVPAYWKDAAAALDAQPHDTRILEIPGSAFATYRWGNAVEPITPGLTSRPYIAREVLPAGTPESFNLLDAFDRRLQNGSFEPAALAPIARLLGAGTVALRSDLAYERSGSPHPRVVWQALTDPRPDGIGAPEQFGPPTPNRASPTDGIDLRTQEAADPPPVALFPVEEADAIVRTRPDRDPVVLAGDGDGIVDAAGAGLVTGHERILELASLDDAALEHALRTGAALVLTDSNRRRNTSFFASIRDTKSPTLRAGQNARSDDGYDRRVDLFADESDAARTVVETRGARVDTSDDGGVDRPEDRATRAFDGDTSTAWRVGGPDPLHTWISVRPDRPVRTDHVDLVQPLGLPRDRWITQAQVTVNGGPPQVVDLGDASFTQAGQRVSFPMTDVRSLKVEITGLHPPPFDPRFANSVGFAEIRLGDVQVREVVRLPVDLARRLGADARGHALAVVLTRLRQETGTDGRQDEEATLDRRFVLPDARGFTLSGTARIDPNGPDVAIDRLLGTAAPGTEYEASSHLVGDPDARASRAFDGDPADAWTSAYGPQNQQWIEVRRAEPITTDRISLDLLADARHSTPTSISVLADGRPLTSVPVSVPDDVAGGDTTTRVPVTITFPSTTATTFRLTVEDGHAPPGPEPPAVAFPPVAFSTVTIPGLAPAPPTATPPEGCVGTIRVDGRATPFRLVGPAVAARTGFAIAACDGPVRLARGSHRVTAPPGSETGLDVDRVVLTSGPDGTASAAGPVVTAARSQPVHVDTSSPSELTVRTRSDGKPFWLVLGQSHSDGWEAHADGEDLGTPALVDGYANAWRVTPDHAGPVTIRLSWTPQRTVWIGLAVSAATVVLCLVVLLVARRRRRRADAVEPVAFAAASPPRPWTWSRPGLPLSAARTVGVTVAAFVATAFVSRWSVAIVAATAAIAGALVPRVRPALAVVAAALLVGARTGHHPGLAWYALALFAVAVTVGVLGRDAEPDPDPNPDDTNRDEDPDDASVAAGGI
jgi:arabinofuranan 3-O-arabinosyltransferase